GLKLAAFSSSVSVFGRWMTQMWSSASTATPAAWPMSQLFGSAFGQAASTSNFGGSPANAGAIDSAPAINVAMSLMSHPLKRRFVAAYRDAPAFQQGPQGGGQGPLKLADGYSSPISFKISSVCSPKSGAAFSLAALHPSITIGVRTPGIEPAFAAALGKSNFMPRWITCGFSNTCDTSLIGPAGTPSASSLSSKSSRFTFTVSAESLPTSSSRWVSRPVLFLYAGFSASSGAPTALQNLTYCASLPVATMA